jgi:hypothetical protein
MEFFLEKIAATLLKDYGNSLNRHCLVFPSRRAGLYFLKYLAVKIDKPVWSPSILTINELFSGHSDLQLAGNEILLFELYKVYRKLKVLPESFDDFYYWGDMLLNDFDDVDKYLVNASLLFSNVKDIKKIDQQFGGLNEEQIAVVKRFWINFNPEKISSEKEGFLSIWSLLNELYNGFRDALRKQNLAYEGMIFRDIAEKPGMAISGVNRWDTVHFVGFNAINECEKSLMLSLKKSGNAKFYWDYDNSYLEETKLNSAGYFLRDNLKLFGNDMPADWSYDTLVSISSVPVVRRVIDASSDVAQVKLISQLLEEIPGLNSGNAHHTAVVLADENLLMPVLTSLPDNIGDINITMGLPLKQTMVYSVIRHLMDLQRTAKLIGNSLCFSSTEAIGILKHPVISGLISDSELQITGEITGENLLWVPVDRFSDSKTLAGIFSRPENPALLSEYFKNFLSFIANPDKEPDKADIDEPLSMAENIKNEYIYRVVLSINRLEKIVSTPDVPFTNETYLKILDRMLRGQSVPFSGEPLSGVQIMGILETRVLDFKNLIILSVNEGILPAVSGGGSYIPFSIREAFGLPSINHQESIYAYHFYRLLQRAENVTFTYNSNSEGLRSGEVSRFLTQMKYENNMKPVFEDLNFEIRSQATVNETLERTHEHQQLLISRFIDKEKSRLLSPSAINTWLSCRMKFFYRYVNNLKEPDRISVDIDPAMLGSILHEVMREIYSEYTGISVTEEMLNSKLINKKALSDLVNNTIKKVFHSGNESLISGNELIVRDVLLAYTVRILKADKSLTPFIIKDLEARHSFNFIVKSGGKNIELLTGGTVDRIDIVNGKTRIVDYKTGNVADTISSTDDLFKEDREKDFDGWLQTMVYCEAYLSGHSNVVTVPSVYAIRKLAGGKNPANLKIRTEKRSSTEVDDYNSVRQSFMTGLNETICKIFDEKEPFTMTSDIRSKCSFCPYRSLCMR